MFSISILALSLLGHSTAPAFKVPVITVHSKEFAFDMPKTIAAGPTMFRLVNDGKEFHQVSIVKLELGKTAVDYAEAMKSGGDTPWAVNVGGPNAASPGQTIAATVTLEPGSYAAVCFIPSPGEREPHAAKGMVAEFSVTPAGVTQAGAAGVETAPDPQPDVHLEMKEYGYQFSKPITAGKHTVHVMNQGEQPHEAIMLRLTPGKHLSDFTAWAESMQGPPPAMTVDGMAAMAKGRTGVFTADFTPGTYAIICYVGDAADHRPHADHGMMVEFEVK